MKREIVISYTISDKKSFEIENSHAIKQFQKYMREVSGLIKNHTISTALNDTRSIDRHLQQFGRTYYKSIKNNFLNNPRHWPKLGKTGRLMRSWVLNPHLIYSYLEKSITEPFKVYLPQLKQFISTLPKIPTHPNMSIGGPALLLTGRSYNSIKYEYGKNRIKLMDGMRFDRSFNFFIGSPYLSNHFLGRITTKNLELIKTTENHGTITSRFRMNLPFVLAPYFANLVLSPVSKNETVQVRFYNKNRKVPKRNPFYLNKESKEKLENLEANFINSTTDSMLNRGLL